MKPVRREDAAQLFRLMSDPRVSTYLAWEPHQSEEETASLLGSLASAWDAGHGYHWTIFDGERAIGIISLIDVQRAHRVWRLERAEIAYWIAPDSQNMGLATEATAAVIRCAFAELKLNRLRISHTSANPASGRIPVKLGFRYIGQERQFFQKNGIWHDMNHYELLAEDWNPAR